MLVLLTLLQAASKHEFPPMPHLDDLGWVQILQAVEESQAATHFVWAHTADNSKTVHFLMTPPQGQELTAWADIATKCVVL